MLKRAYSRLGDAIANNNVETMRSLIDTSVFHATLPGIEGPPLNFLQFVAELDRQRTMFSDFGRNIQTHSMIVDDNHLATWYTMTVTNDGPRKSYKGQAVLPPTNKQLAIASMDMVTFNDFGVIVGLTVVSDRMDTLDQMA